MSVKTESTRIARNGFKGIAHELRHRIESGRIEPGRYLPTERELQQEFGASRSTVRRALAMLVESGWAQSIPSKGAIASSGQKRSVSHNIAFIDGSSYVLRVLYLRIAELLLEHGLHLIHLGGGAEAPVEDRLRYAAENDLAGAFVWPFVGFPNPDLATSLTKVLPTVCLDHVLRGVPTDLVSFDYLGATETATHHLVRQGCKRIGITGMYDMLHISHERFSGYMKAMFDAGLQPNARDYLFTYTSGMRCAETDVLAQRLSQPDRPDGMVVCQDEFVPSTIEAAHRAGLRVPEDLKLVTLGDDVEVQVGNYGLTAVALDWESLARQAVGLLLERIGDRSSGPKTRIAPHRLIVRGLCGAPPSEWTGDPERLSGFHGDAPYPKSCYKFTPASPAVGVL
jgi:DNA-binding LacI/PurR family transcriptional regulator